MTFPPVSRIVYRGLQRRLLEDISGANQHRAFSQVYRQSFPRIKPSRRLINRLPPSEADERITAKDKVEDVELIESLEDVVRFADGKSNVGKESIETSVVKEIDEAPPLERQAQEVSPRPHHLSIKAKEEPIIPWYLQSQNAITRPAPPAHLLEKQRIPETPENAPALLQPLLNYISTDLGIDHLSLLDLRSLDPPAALGANLIMIVGTARGEKHLHVSADRLCRWLRSTHKLSPKADGLLGRNELKIKLKRKNKRLKVLAHVGTVDSPGVDDGLQTGWVCVNVSGVKSAEAFDQHEKQADHGFVGFGESISDTTIILHMMTEGKREELDLETLWNNRVKRRRIKAQEDGAGANWGSFTHEAKLEEGELIG